ncbi:hypothetical protein GGI04_000635 [Coemansia thaxteri]|nr:hypothetical protein GGI04_000635 [Coemansia thaxteri]KAJ2473063.1 hypothetical protein GGI02_001141 [Coemansia sp. RSA 2322]KAJ2486463.1 hypothetical protein EV174_001085 [Coemansia sp. RSA 2320]
MASTTSAQQRRTNFGSLIFCPLCGNLLDSPGDQDHIVCHACGEAQDGEQFEDIETVSRSQDNAFPSRLRNKRSLVQGVGEGERVNARVEETCPECGCTEMTFYTIQMRSADEGQTVFYKCVNYSWNTVSFAFLNRYPNPFASHVLSADTLDRRIDAATGTLHITRLLRKTNSVPRWARSIFRGNDAYILEEVMVNRETGQLVAKTRNITHTRLLKVEERLTLQADPASAGSTLCKNETSIVSNIGYGLNAKIETFSLSRFNDNIAKSRKGMLYALDLVQRKGLFRHRLRAEQPADP